MTALSLEFSPVFLKNPISCGLFSYFLESEYNCENLLFWHAVENFKQITDAHKLPDAANEIFNKYIATGSPEAVNLGFTVVQSLQKKLRDLLCKLEGTNTLRVSASDAGSKGRPPYNDRSLQNRDDDPSSRDNDLSEDSLNHRERRDHRPNHEHLAKQKERGHWRGWGSGEHHPSVENQVDEYMNAGFHAEFGSEKKLDVKQNPVTTENLENTDKVSEGDNNDKADATKPVLAEVNDKVSLYQQLHGIFDEAQEHIFQLMKMDPYPRFLKSEAYSHLLAFRPSPRSSTVHRRRHPLEEMVSEGFLQAAERQDGWEEMTEQDGVILSRKKFADIYSTRGIGIVDAAPSVIFDLVNDVSKRQLWDDLFCEGHEVERLDDNMIVYYMAWNSPSKLAYNRDFVVLRVSRSNEDDGSYVCVSKSISHPQVPPRQGFVRAEMECSGFIIRPCGPAQSLVIYLAQIDPKGKIPKSVESHVSQHRPLCILQLRQLVRDLKLSNTTDTLPPEQWHNASPFSQHTWKRLNRASVYMPNTRVFNTTPHSWSPNFPSTSKLTSTEDYEGSPEISELRSNSDSKVNLLSSDKSKSSSTLSSSIDGALGSKSKSYTKVIFGSSPTAGSSPPTKELNTDQNSSKINPISNADSSREKSKIIIIGAPETSKSIKLAGTPPSNPNTPPDSISRTPPYSPNRLIIGTTPPDILMSRTHSPTKLNVGTPPAPDTLDNRPRNNSNSKLNLITSTQNSTPPDSPGESRHKLSLKLTGSPSKSPAGTPHSTPPGSPRDSKKSNSKLNLVPPSGEESAGETEEPTKKKNSKLNLLVGRLTGNSSSDDEKPSLWSRATKHFHPSSKHPESE